MRPHYWVSFFPSRVLAGFPMQCRVHFICQTFEPGTEAKYSSEKTVWSCPLSSTHGSPISPNFRFAFSWARISCFLRFLEANPHSGAFVYQFQWLSFALPSSSSSFWKVSSQIVIRNKLAEHWFGCGWGMMPQRMEIHMTYPIKRFSTPVVSVIGLFLRCHIDNRLAFGGS